VQPGPEPPDPAPRAGEESLEAEALALDLRQALLACLAGDESRRWTVGELLARLKGLGVPCSRASIAGALGELELELSLCPWAPWRLLERGQEWVLAPRSRLVELLGAARALPVDDPGQLSDQDKAVLLVVIGHRRKGGVSKTRIGEILGLDPAPPLDGLLRLGLVYADPGRQLAFWRPRPEALLALGFRASADIPALRELEDYFDGRRADPGPLDGQPGRRLKRERRRRQSLGEPPAMPSSKPGEERPTDFLGAQADPPLPHPDRASQRVVRGEPA